MEFSRQLHNCVSWIFSLVCAFLKKFLQPKESIAIPPSRPVSVNYHFTRQCNYACKFCFHTALTSFVMPLHEAKHGMKLMSEAGMKKINFSGGEPFLVQRGKFLGELVKYCKRELLLESVTIVTNGSLVTQEWFESYGEYLDILAVSCDSFNEDVNRKNGRHAKGKNHLETLEQVGFWCTEFGVLFKINSVITIHNYKEDMVREIQRLNPVRWKVFQCLLIDGENAGEGALRDARELTISDEQFELFSAKHRHLEQFVPESNEAMRNSYLLLDEYMRFLDNRDGKKTPSKSILDVGVERALKFSGFDEQMFKKRGGRYKWSKADTLLQW